MKYFGCDPNTKWGSRQQDWFYANWKEKLRLTLRFILTWFGKVLKYFFGWPMVLMLWIFPDGVEYETRMFALSFGFIGTVAWTCISLLYIFWLLGGQ